MFSLFSSKSPYTLNLNFSSKSDHLSDYDLFSDDDGGETRGGVPNIHARSRNLDERFSKFEKGDTATITKLKKELALNHEIYLGLLGSYKQTKAELNSLHKHQVRQYYLHLYYTLFPRSLNANSLNLFQ